MSIFLIGYRGTGKSTVARLLAERLGWSCVDADEWIEQRAGKSIREIFAEEGERGFRDRETEVVQELSQLPQRVVSLGGGAVLREENRASLRGAGPIVWLKARPETLYERITTDPTTHERRPNLTGAGGLEEIRELLARREPVYAASADFAVETDDKLPSQICEEILSLVEARGER